MPIILSSPESKPAIVAHEIVSFDINLQAMTAAIEFISIDANGGRATAFGVTCSLLASDVPRFTPAEYASIKSALYRLAIEDGHVAGTVA